MAPVNSDGGIAWFGKLQHHGDFIRSTDKTPLVDALDSWLSLAMDRIRGEPDWKIRYDRSPPRFFGFVDLEQGLACAGYMLPGRDQSDRRFPFAVMRSIKLAEPGQFLRRCPLMLSRLWLRMQTQVDQLMLDTACGSHALSQSALTLPIETDARAFDAVHEDFLSITTADTVNQWLARARHSIDLWDQTRRLPSPSASSAAAVMALPADSNHRFSLATFWLDLLLAGSHDNSRLTSIFLDATDDRPCLRVFRDRTPGESLTEVLIQAASETELAGDAHAQGTGSRAWPADTRLAAIRQSLEYRSR